MDNLIEYILYFRHIRIFGLSSLELIPTFLVIYFLASIYCKINFWSYHFPRNLFLIFSFAIFIHYIFEVNTQLNWMLNLSKCPPDYNSLTGIFNC